MLDSALVYDIETFPNCFTFHFEMLNSKVSGTFEISHFRDDRTALIQFFNWLRQTQTAMIGFNNIHFDYPVCHFIYMNPTATVEEIYAFAMSIINSKDRFGHTIWERDRFAPQIDLFKINHFDNKAKSTGLKALQINMRAESVVDMPVANGTFLNQQQIDESLIPYNKHDVTETKDFALINMDALRFRVDQIPQFGVDVMNWPDTKIGARLMEKRLGDELCFDRSTGYGRGRMRQTPRSKIAINDIIFPYVRFEHPEFNRVLDYLRGQVLTSQDIEEIGNDEQPAGVQTKGVFKGLKAVIDGFEFHFGVGGIHGSISSQRVIATDEWLIRDIDVASLYPSIAIVNNLYPEHLEARFVEVYAQLPKERKEWQVKKGKKCVEANTLKLASNGVYGNSNNKFSVFYDPKYTMSITINGQLMLCMLAEQLMKVPTLKLLQINTDGATYLIHRDYEPIAKQVCKWWESITRLTLEDADYNRIFIRDVNNYIAEGLDGLLKLKGAYWSPDPLDYANSISQAQPPAWHKDLGNTVSVRAAVAAMIHGVDPEQFVRLTTNPYDFMLRIKVGRADQLMFRTAGTVCELQRNTRYFVSTNGGEMTKHSPPSKDAGRWKKKNGVSDFEYERVMAETGNQWDERVCTKNKSKYEERRTAVQAGFKTTPCNKVGEFSFESVDYAYYINEARKLII